MEMETQLFWDASVEELKQGYIEEKQGFRCILCGQLFTKGEIYTVHGKLYDAEKAVVLHIQEEHQSVLSYMLKVQPSSMGISELQLQLINLFAGDRSDKEIANYLGVAGSTIRNHRFKLREKEKQARVFLALMELLEEKEQGEADNKYRYGEEQSIEQQNGYTLAISKKEETKIIERHLTPSGRLKSYPNYEKGKQVILNEIIRQFHRGESYNEEEVYHILSNIYRDCSFLKRELIEYNLLGKTDKGAVYWVREQNA